MPHDDIFRLATKAPGPSGALPLTEELLLTRPSGDLFGLTQNAGMGWKAEELWRKQYLILSTQGGLRAPDGTPIALGYHTGHWEIGELVRAAAEEIRERVKREHGIELEYEVELWRVEPSTEEEQEL